MPRGILTAPNIVGTVQINGNAGTAGQVLTSQGSSALPTWSAVGASNKYPDGWVFSNANATAATTTTSQSIFQAGARSFALTAGKTYYFQLKVDLNISFPAGSAFAVRLDPTFSQAPQSINYHSTFFTTGNSTTPYSALITTTGVQQVTQNFSASSSGYLLVDGFFRANATTGGTVEFKYQLSVGTPGGSATARTGSWLKITDLGVSTAPGIIAGTWT